MTATWMDPQPVSDDGMWVWRDGAWVPTEAQRIAIVTANDHAHEQPAPEEPKPSWPPEIVVIEETAKTGPELRGPCVAKPSRRGRKVAITVTAVAVAVLNGPIWAGAVEDVAQVIETASRR